MVVVIVRYSERRLFQWFEAGDEGEAPAGSCMFIEGMGVIWLESDSGGKKQ